MASTGAALVAFACTLFGVPALAAEEAPDTADSVAAAREHRDVVGRLELGYRGVFVTNPGYNAFSTQDYFSGISLLASRTVFAGSHLSFALGLAWDFGTSSATTRGDESSLEVHRLTAPLEARAHVGHWGYGFVRVAPGAAYEHIELDEPSAPSSILGKSAWLFTTDASVGYAIPLVPLPDRPGRRVRAWLQGDVGYSWVADSRLVLTPTSSGAGTDTVDLGASLGLRGAFLRVAAAVSY
jgi:hypothetical protein